MRGVPDTVRVPPTAPLNGFGPVGGSVKMGWMGELGGSGEGNSGHGVGATNGATKQVWASRWQRETGLDAGAGRER